MKSGTRIFMLTSRLYETAGGRTKATIDRMMLLQNYFNVTLIEMSATKYPGEELPKVFKKYKTKFNVINPWYDIDENTINTMNYLEFIRVLTGSLGDESIFSGAQKSFTLPTLSGGKIKSFLEKGKIARLRVYHSDGKVDFLALNDQQNIFLRELYEGDKLLARYYLNNSGKVSSGFVVNNNDNRKYVYRTKEDTLLYFDDIYGYNLEFLNNTLRDGDILISDVRYYDEVLRRLKPKLHIIHVWHEVVLNLTSKSGLNPAYQIITDPRFPLARSDKIVVFTDDAREEYAAEFTHLKDNLTVIPYGITPKPELHDVDRDKDLVISVGRLVSIKNIAAQIHAFAIFHNKYPETKFYIFGEGSEREPLFQLIQEMGLENSVKLCGFSDNIDKTFQGAAMMVFSSDHETFGLVILESLSNGTPVASYDVRFGTKYLLSNSRSGIIAKNNTPESLAKAMIKLRKRNLAPRKVKDTVGKFSRKRFEDAWIAIISDATGVHNENEK